MEKHIIQLTKKITKSLINNFMINYNNNKLYSKNKEDIIKNLHQTIGKYKKEGDTLETKIIQDIFEISRNYLNDACAVITDNNIDLNKYNKFIIYLHKSLSGKDDFKLNSLDRFNHDKLDGLYFIVDRDNTVKQKLLKLYTLRI